MHVPLLFCFGTIKHNNWKGQIKLLIYHFYSRTAFKKIPAVEGKEIDLYLLYWLVTAQGGWEKVSCPKKID